MEKNDTPATGIPIDQEAVVILLFVLTVILGGASILITCGFITHLNSREDCSSIQCCMILWCPGNFVLGIYLSILSIVSVMHSTWPEEAHQKMYAGIAGFWTFMGWFGMMMCLSFILNKYVEYREELVRNHTPIRNDESFATEERLNTV